MSGAYSQRFKQFEREHVEELKNRMQDVQPHDTLSKAKKLSLETNKRRKASAIKRKLEAQREEGRRQEILSKRREHQRQATEKYQRSHLRSRSPGDVPVLEEALRLVRGSGSYIRQNSAGAVHSAQTSPSVQQYDESSDPMTRPYLNKFARQKRRAKSATVRENREAHQVELHSKSLKNLTSSRSMFEQQLHQHQQLLKEQQQRTLNDFSEVLNKEIFENSKLLGGEVASDGSDSICSDDSLDDSKTSSQRSVDQESTSLVTQGSNASSAPTVQSDTYQNTKQAPDSFYLNRTTSVDSISMLNSSLQSTHLSPAAYNNNFVNSNLTDIQPNSQVRNDIQSQKGGISHFSQAPSVGDVSVSSGYGSRTPFSYSQTSHQNISNSSLPIHSVSSYSHVSSGQYQKQAQGTAAILSPHTDPSYQQDLTSFRSVYSNQGNTANSNPHYLPSSDSVIESRPSIQLRAWATPSPSIDSAHGSNAQNLTSNTKPYSSKPTSTYATTTSLSSQPNLTDTVTYSQSTVVSNTRPTNTVTSTSKSQSNSTKTTTALVPEVMSPPSNHVKLDSDVTKVNAVRDRNFVKFEAVKNPVEPKVEKNNFNQRERVGSATSSVHTTGSEKTVKSILKKSGGGLSKNSDGSGTIKGASVRDSVEVTKSHYQQHTDTPKKVRRKGVRFADMTYEEEIQSDSDVNDDVDNEINKVEAEHRAQVYGDRKLSQKPPRPESARLTSQVKSETPNRKSRVSSASAVGQNHTDKTPPAKPQGTAHIITRGSAYNQSDTNNNSDQVRKVAVVSRNFMDKTPISKSNTSFGSVNRKATVYTLSEMDSKSGFVASQTNGHDGQPKPPLSYDGHDPLSSDTMPSVKNNYDSYNSPVYNENGLRIDRTPTDEEINYLWEKVRTCLNRSASNQSISGNSSSDQLPYRQTAPVSNKVFDGDSLGYHNGMRGFSSRTANPNNNVHPNYLKKPAGSYTQKYGLLQQRRQAGPKMDPKAKATKHVPTTNMPLHSQREPEQAIGFFPEKDVSESLAAFMVAEQLANQSLSGSQIQKAMDSAEQRQHSHNSENIRQKVPTILSIEEQRLLESLDRLNEKLKLTDIQPQLKTDVTPAPPAQAVAHGGGFKGRQPLSAHQPRLGSAKTYNRSGSATLPRRQLSARHY